MILPMPPPTGISHTFPLGAFQLAVLMGADAGLPDDALYIDLDYYGLQPKVDADAVRHYVAEILAKAIEILAKINAGICEIALKI